MARVIDEEPSAQDLEELDMARDELLERFEAGDQADLGRPQVLVIKSKLDVRAEQGVNVTDTSGVHVAKSSQAEIGISLRR